MGCADPQSLGQIRGQMGRLSWPGLTRPPTRFAAANGCKALEFAVLSILCLGRRPRFEGCCDTTAWMGRVKPGHDGVGGAGNLPRSTTPKAIFFFLGRLRPAKVIATMYNMAGRAPGAFRRP